jgi:hypothetical protein
VVEYLNKKEVFHPESFERFIVDCTRVGSLKSFEMMWNISVASATEKVSDRLFHFSRLLFLTSQDNHQFSSENLNRFSKQIEDFYTTMFAISSPQYLTSFNHKEFLGLINSYSPHAARAFQTYFAINFLNLQDTSSFKAFQFPSLLGESDCLDPAILSVLSLCNDNLQGAWKRLYRSSYDGRSFQRIMYELLGYEVVYSLKE